MESMQGVIATNPEEQLGTDHGVLAGLQDSPHFKNEQRKQAQTDARIQKLRAKAKAVTQAELAASSKCVCCSILSLSTSYLKFHQVLHLHNRQNLSS